MAKQKVDQEQYANAVKVLRDHLGFGGTIFTITRYSKSGMSRWVRVVVPGQDHNGRPDIIDITYYISLVTDLTLANDGLKFGGSGYDADVDIVQAIQRVLELEPIRHANGYREDKIRSRKLMSY